MLLHETLGERSIMEINAMRTLNEAAKMFKNEDPKTCITYSTLRRLCIEKKVKLKFTQLCPTLVSPVDSTLPSSSVHGILQARILEWGSVP